MDKDKLLIAVYDDENAQNAGYRGLSTFSEGLVNGFRQIGVKSYFVNECIQKGLSPNLVIGFNTNGLSHWQNFLNKNITNIMWCTDSLFYQQFDVVNQFAAYKKFVMFNSCPNDIEALKHYIPSLVHGYIPFGVDLDFWKKQDVEKEYDITFVGSIGDYDEQIQKLKEIMPTLVFNLMMEFCEVALAKPGLSLWDIYSFFKKQLGMEFDASQYVLMAKSISSVITYKQRIKMIQALKDFNITILGEGPWEKYITDNITLYKGKDITDTLSVLNKSKITLHSQPFQLSGGVHDRVMNASAVETMVLTAENPTLNLEFKDAFAYCNPITYEDIADKANYYLKNQDERTELAKKASNIVKSKYKWADRAQNIVAIID